MRVTDDNGNERKVPNKIQVSFKTPDCLYYAVQELTRRSDLDAGAKEEAFQMYSEKLKKWLEYSEGVTIEFDVENMIATVVES